MNVANTNPTKSTGGNGTPPSPKGTKPVIGTTGLIGTGNAVQGTNRVLQKPSNPLGAGQGTNPVLMQKPSNSLGGGSEYGRK
jgi:hypothetical protein